MEAQSKTTIAISTDLRERIKNLGTKGESYEQILEDMYLARKNELISEILMDTTDTVTLEEFRKEVKKLPDD